jgi:hypothetical protein
MVSRMYCWNLHSGNISEGPYLIGVTDDLAMAMRLCETHIRSGRAFLGYIEAVRPAISADGLDPCYVRTGRRWTGRRTNTDRVRWDERDDGFGTSLMSPS